MHFHYFVSYFYTKILKRKTKSDTNFNIPFLYTLQVPPFYEEDWQTAESLSVKAWWKTYHPTLALTQIALRVATMPSSVAACDRSFSCQKHIHTDIRNRLADDVVNKLTFIKAEIGLQR